jgi:glycosyltransferase involved in cell wall biosynthesis
MRVTHIASGDLWAGAEKQLYVLLTALARYESVAVNAIILNSGVLAQRLRDAGISVLELNERLDSPLVLYQQICRHLRALRPDLVHTHRVKENVIGGLAAWRLAIPSLRTQHGRHEGDRSSIDLRRLVVGLADFVLGRCIQRCVIAVSEPLGDELRRLFGPDHVVVIPNGIFPPDPSPADDPRWLCEEPWRIGFVGRLVPLKRVDLFLEIASWMQKHSEKDDQPAFVVIGDGPLRLELERQAREIGSDADVRFKGHVEDPAAEMARLHAMVICSDHEGLPMAALEAMQLGVIVIAHRVGGLPSLLGEGDSGVLVEAQSPSAFGGAILDLLANPQRASELSSRARERVAKMYSASAMAASYVETYQRIIADSKG